MKYEDIDSEAISYSNQLTGLGYSEKMIAEEAFIIGAKWALKNQWISVKDRLPSPDENEVFTVSGDEYNIAWYSERKKNFYNFDGIIVIPTHWMPTSEINLYLKELRANNE